MKSPTLLQQTQAKIADIVVRDRLRPVSEAGVQTLIASITETGVMKDAIHLRKKKDGRLYLIAGGHRMAAAINLGWEEIEAKIWTDVTDDWSRMMEIDDNLAGCRDERSGHCGVPCRTQGSLRATASRNSARRCGRTGAPRVSKRHDVVCCLDCREVRPVEAPCASA